MGLQSLLQNSRSLTGLRYLEAWRVGLDGAVRRVLLSTRLVRTHLSLGSTEHRFLNAAACPHVTSRINCSTASARMPNIRWQSTLGAPRTRTQRPP